MTKDDQERLNSFAKLNSKLKEYEATVANREVFIQLLFLFNI